MTFLARLALILTFAQCGGAPVRVMPIGDSITHGVGDPAFAGYRGPLQALLMQRGVAVDFVGSQLAGPDYMDREHEGHDGYETWELLAGFPTWFPAARPNVVLLMAGTNDIGVGTTDTEHKIMGLVDDIAGRSRSTFILVSSVPPWLDNAKNAEVDRVNAALPGLIAERHKYGIQARFVNAGGSIDRFSDLTGDGIHPVVSGYKKMAAAWDEALTRYQAFFLCNTRPPVRTSSVVTGGGSGLDVTVTGPSPLVRVTVRPGANATATDPVVVGNTATFSVAQVDPGPFLVPFIAVDEFGPWNTFVGSTGV